MKTAVWIAVLLPSLVQAQTSPPQGQAPAACSGCHGAEGQGNPAVGAPRIAGQSAAYLAKQLDSYANGSRRSAVMEPIAKGLSSQARTEFAAYYAQRQAPRGAVDDARPPQRGRELATRGDNRLSLPACINCHGPAGVGEPPFIPYIAGLDANYLGAALKAWKAGTRANDAGQQMTTIAQALSDQDVEAVARYYASLPPPAPVPLNIVQTPSRRPAGKVQKPAMTEPAAGVRKSVGVEQGAPTTGSGTQGPGGTEQQGEQGSR